jgi:hypothetical protein
MGKQHTLFGQVREPAFELWQQGTKRDCFPINDVVLESYECKWQDRAVFELGYDHISIFCSLADWASNVSDILRNNLYDCFDLLDDEDRQALFRYYTRLLLVISELLSDFEQMVVAARRMNNLGAARNLLSNTPGEVHAVFGFINSVCKHKAKGIHRCNHHLPLWFDDYRVDCPFSKPI